MKVTKAAGIQCAILVFILAAEVVFADRYHTAYHMEQTADADLQSGAERNAGNGLSEENAVSDLQDGAGGSDDVLQGRGGYTGSDLQAGGECDDSSQEKENFVYQDEMSAEPLQMLNGEVIFHGDINFDGYPDVRIYDSEKEESSYYLWDKKERQFVEAVMSINIDWIETEKLDDSEAYWDPVSVWNDERELQEMTEKLYQWDENVLKEIRSISCRFEGEEVVITLSDEESGECSGTGTFAKKGWETNPEVRALYAQFYRGYAPEEFYYMRHDAPGKEQVIPEDLAKALKQAFENGTTGELFTSLAAGRELSENEKKAAAVKNADISWFLENTSAEMILVDLDNDGFEDIYVKADFGGSGGFGEYALCQGDGSGEYRKTGLGTEEYVRNIFHVICWEGKNYVCHRKGGRNGTGLILEGYRDGKLVETVSFNRVPGKQTDSVIFCRDGYREMAGRELEEAPKIFDRTEKSFVAVGDAEQKVESGKILEDDVFLCDIDNDGTVEKYKKHLIDYPINFLYFEMEDIAQELTVIPYCRDETGTEIMMWVDACDGKNIMNVMYTTGLYEYVVEGFLVNDTGGYRNLYAIERKTELEVEEVRTWEVPGKRIGTP